jgi:hypothetical protein
MPYITPGMSEKPKKEGPEHLHGRPFMDQHRQEWDEEAQDHQEDLAHWSQPL